MLRPSLLPGLLDACVHNRRRERRDVRLFETGSRVHWTTARDGRRHSPGAARAGSALVRRAARRGLLRCQGHGRGDRRRRGGPLELRHVDSAVPRPGPGCGVHRLACPAGPVRSGLFGQLLPAVAEARGFPGRRGDLRRRDRPELLARSTPATISGQPRCRAIPRSCAISRCWSTKPCLPLRFVARSVRKLPTRWPRSRNSIAIRAKACRKVESACRCASRSVRRIAR